MTRTPPRTLVVRLIALLVLAAFGWQAALAQVPADRTEYELPGEGVFPEGIAYHEPSNSIFVSGAGSGGIYQVNEGVSSSRVPTQRTFSR